VKIIDFIREELILPDIRATKKAAVIRELAAHLGRIECMDANAIERVLEAREQLGSTAVGEGIAIPHGKMETADRLIGCLGRSRKGVDFGSEDGKPTHFFFALVAPEGSTGDHLKALARISRLFRDPSIRARLTEAETAAGIYAILEQEERAVLR
jgi:nitrogen PTS system EIIA component